MCISHSTYGFTVVSVRVYPSEYPSINIRLTNTFNKPQLKKTLLTTNKNTTNNYQCITIKIVV